MKAEAEAAQEAEDAELQKAVAELKAMSEGLCHSVNVDPEDARLVETDGACVQGVWCGGMCVSCCIMTTVTLIRATHPHRHARPADARVRRGRG